MLIVFNVLLILFILLIAYWWANQGFFSAVLHLLCVIVAGAIALAFWEPLTVGMLLRGNTFDNYAWGVSLVGLFAVSLLVLRIAMDKLAPANVDLPHGFSLGLGGLAGATAGVLTIGFFLIGASFVQSSNSIMGWQGHQRTSTGELAPTGTLWVPYHQIVSEFYDWMSVGALATNRPLRHYNPDLHVQATAFRDTWSEGRGRVTFAPEFAEVTDFYHCPDNNQYAVKVHFTSGAFDDEGRNLIIAGSQVRMIGDTNGSQEPPVAHPIGWAQYTQDSPRAASYFLFDSPSQYVTNIPAKQDADILFVFNTTMANPRFLQVKNVRYLLPPSSEEVQLAAFESIKRDFAPPSGEIFFDPRAPQLVPADIQVNSSLRPLVISVNQLPSSMSQVDNKLSDGHGLFPPRGDRVGGELQITSILEPEGARVIQLNVGKRSSATVFSIAARQAGREATPYLIDANGGSYKPFGFIHERTDNQTEIFLDPKNGIQTLDQLLLLLRGGDGEVRLLFYVTEGATIRSFRLNDVTVGNCTVEVTAAR